jgi:hypothetical protein
MLKWLTPDHRATFTVVESVPRWRFAPACCAAQSVGCFTAQAAYDSLCPECEAEELRTNDALACHRNASSPGSKAAA